MRIVPLDAPEAPEPQEPPARAGGRAAERLLGRPAAARGLSGLVPQEGPEDGPDQGPDRAPANGPGERPRPEPYEDEEQGGFLDRLTSAAPGPPMVEVSRLSHSFGGHWALSDISFSLDKGDFLFLFGPSGAGKTTLLRILHAALPVQRGQARVAGFDLRALSRSDAPRLRRQVSVVFQDFKIMQGRTVYENVALPLEVRGMARPLILRRVRAVLRSLELEHKSGCPCSRLSGGEQQRVAIARAVVVNPQVILADEPTGNLDHDLSLRLMEVLSQFHLYGATVILATHNRELLTIPRRAKVLELHDGRILRPGEVPPPAPEAEACRP